MQKSLSNNFTEGPILSKLLKFMLPVLFAMFLQSTYGAVDLLVVGRFASPADLSGVATGSQIMHTFTNILVSFTMGITVLLGRKLGEKRASESSDIIGTGLILFAITGAILTVICTVFAGPIATTLEAPPEAFEVTKKYISICGGGFLIITAYNLLGSIFRGLGDSKTPLIAVGIACVINIFGDLLLVKGFHMGAAGAAIATVASQLISVIISLIIISKQNLPFKMSRKSIRLNKGYAKSLLKIGTPIGLQDLLVGISFLIIMAIVNSLGLVESAGIGVAEKVCAFIMLVPAAFMQSMSSFVAQNIGAAKPERARKALLTGIEVSFAFGVAMFVVGFFFGNHLCAIFSNDAATIASAFDYLKAYAIDCLLTCFLFCFIGYYNGLGKTGFVMIQGLAGAFLIRVPVAFIMRQIGHGSMFLIGLSVPCSTVFQIAICMAAYKIFIKKENKQ